MSHEKQNLSEFDILIFPKKWLGTSNMEKNTWQVTNMI